MSESKKKVYELQGFTVYDLNVIPEITNIQDKEQTFINWTKQIKFEDKYIILPDNTRIDGTIFLNNQLQFDNGSYTKLLMNYFYD